MMVHGFLMGKQQFFVLMWKVDIHLKHFLSSNMGRRDPTSQTERKWTERAHLKDDFPSTKVGYASYC